MVYAVAAVEYQVTHSSMLTSIPCRTAVFLHCEKPLYKANLGICIIPDLLNLHVSSKFPFTVASPGRAMKGFSWSESVLQQNYGCCLSRTACLADGCMVLKLHTFWETLGMRSHQCQGITCQARPPWLQPVQLSRTLCVKVFGQEVEEDRLW